MWWNFNVWGIRKNIKLFESLIEWVFRIIIKNNIDGNLICVVYELFFLELIWFLRRRD